MTVSPQLNRCMGNDQEIDDMVLDSHYLIGSQSFIAWIQSCAKVLKTATSH